MPKRILQGIIKSAKMEKTAVVEVKKFKKHPKYLKGFWVSKKYKAHNEENFQAADKVEIEETKPLSRDKRWKIIKKV